MFQLYLFVFMYLYVYINNKKPEVQTRFPSKLVLTSNEFVTLHSPLASYNLYLVITALFVKTTKFFLKKLPSFIEPQ